MSPFYGGCGPVVDLFFNCMPYCGALCISYMCFALLCFLSSCANTLIGKLEVVVLVRSFSLCPLSVVLQ